MHIKNTAMFALLLIATVSLSAQSTYTPPVLPPIISVASTNSSIAMMADINTNVDAYKKVLLAHDNDLYGNGIILAMRTAQQADAKAIAGFVDQSAAIVALKAQLAADEVRLTALETKLAALTTKTVTAGTALTTP